MVLNSGVIDAEAISFSVIARLSTSSVDTNLHGDISLRPVRIFDVPQEEAGHKLGPMACHLEIDGVTLCPHAGSSPHQKVGTKV